MKKYVISIDNPKYIPMGIKYDPKKKPVNEPCFIQAEVILLSDHEAAMKAKDLEIKTLWDALDRV